MSRISEIDRLIGMSDSDDLETIEKIEILERAKDLAEIDLEIRDRIVGSQNDFAPIHRIDHQRRIDALVKSLWTIQTRLDSYSSDRSEFEVVQSSRWDAAIGDLFELVNDELAEAWDKRGLAAKRVLFGIAVMCAREGAGICLSEVWIWGESASRRVLKLVKEALRSG